MTSESQRRRTLLLCGILHAFTHVYHVALMPLYLLIHDDLRLSGAGAAPFLVTLMGLAYFLPSYFVGILSDRCNRKILLAAGLLVNGIGFAGLATAKTYETAMAWVILAGLGGSFYHPAATALVARLYPIGTGRALGLIGMGASAGFFLGPLYCGWRAAATGSWRTPVLELGIAGVAGALIFFWVAQDDIQPVSTANKTESNGLKLFPTAGLLMLFIAVSFAFSLRDFAGSGVGTMSSLFLQRAHGLDPKLTGMALSAIFLASAISNPLFGELSDRGRTRWTLLVLACAAVLIAVFPRVPPQWSSLVLAAYGFFFLASYPMVEAALMLSVPDEVRGRVFGLFITIGGMLGTLSHWIAGNWVEQLGSGSNDPAKYHPLYAALACAVLVSMLGLAGLKSLRRKEGLG